MFRRSWKQYNLNNKPRLEMSGGCLWCCSRFRAPKLRWLYWAMSTCMLQALILLPCASDWFTNVSLVLLLEISLFRICGVIVRCFPHRFNRSKTMVMASSPGSASKGLLQRRASMLNARPCMASMPHTKANCLRMRITPWMVPWRALPRKCMSSQRSSHWVCQLLPGTMGARRCCTEIHQHELYMRCKSTWRVNLFSFPPLLGLRPSTKKKEDVRASPLDSLTSCGGNVPSGCSFHLGQMCGDIVCTVWFLQDTDDSKEANLKVSMADVEINLNVGQSRSTTKESSTVALPRFVNTRVVDEGTALVYCQQPKEDTKSLKRPYDAI